MTTRTRKRPTLGPLHTRPLSFRAPFDEPRQLALFDVTAGRSTLRAERLAALTDALAGVELGAHDRRILEWLTRWGDSTVGTLVSLLLRARAAGPTK